MTDTTPTVTLRPGDCLTVLRGLPDASVDAVVTDPPYGLSEVTSARLTTALTAWVNGDRDHVPDGKGFMGKSWDAFVPPPAVWDECMRVLKPGGHMLVFSGSRTVDLMGLSIRLAGFEIRDTLQWLYGSGFPKSLDVGKAIDKARDEDRAPVDTVRAWLDERRRAAGVTLGAINAHFGHAGNGGGSASSWTTNQTSCALPTVEQWERLRDLIGFGPEMDAEVWRLNGRKGTPGEAWDRREVLDTRQVGDIRNGHGRAYGGAMFAGADTGKTEHRITAPATDAAREWEGWGTALKPAAEPIIMARKPFATTVAKNVLAHGVGGINIDGCRVGSGGQLRWSEPRDMVYHGGTDVTGSTATESNVGRFPANVVLTHNLDCTDACTSSTPEGCTESCPVAELDAQSGDRPGFSGGGATAGEVANDVYGSGWKPNANPAYFADSGGASRFFPSFRYQAKAPKRERPTVDGVSHPTVKPLALMRWLVRLVTPPGGTVLDPFAGSGTTGQAARDEGMVAILVEREPEYRALIEHRMGEGLDVVEPEPEPEPVDRIELDRIVGQVLAVVGKVGAGVPGVSRAEERALSAETVAEAEAARDDLRAALTAARDAA